MAHQLSPWPCAPKNRHVPPLDLLLPFIEPPGPGDHQLWNGIDPAHPAALFNDYDEAAFLWQGKRYPVVRVLLFYIGLDGPQIFNTCGASKCCNLEHWHAESEEERKERISFHTYVGFNTPDFRKLD